MQQFGGCLGFSEIFKLLRELLPQFYGDFTDFGAETKVICGLNIRDLDISVISTVDASARVYF